MNTTKHEKTIKELFIGECWEYLRKNFRKFNQTNKIKIALELCKKDIPQEIVGDGIQKEIIIIRDGNKTEAVAGPVHIQQEPLPRPMGIVGDRQKYVADLAGNAIQRADSE
jgi:hypothetical protein